ncbi:hypothetical protein [Bradyrhizobium vignae]|uniref:hypothetical protein n=1 Tax=Bradyrhizobium vignae TaxID=1549949 RepID=UPI0024BF8176|nr:hypothetical protein [Bradyrhizobium vignae]
MVLVVYPINRRSGATISMALQMVAVSWRSLRLVCGVDRLCENVRLRPSIPERISERTSMNKHSTTRFSREAQILIIIWALRAEIVQASGCFSHFPVQPADMFLQGCLRRRRRASKAAGKRFFGTKASAWEMQY